MELGVILKYLDFEQENTYLSIQDFIQKCKELGFLDILEINKIEYYGFEFTICKELKQFIVQSCDVWLQNTKSVLAECTDIKQLLLEPYEIDYGIQLFEQIEGYNLDYMWLQSDLNYQKISPAIFSNFLALLRNYYTIPEFGEKKPHGQSLVPQALAVKDRLKYCQKVLIVLTNYISSTKDLSNDVLKSLEFCKQLSAGLTTRHEPIGTEQTT